MNTDVTAVIPAKIESAKKYICKQTVNSRKKFGQTGAFRKLLYKGKIFAPENLIRRGGELL
jgi:hypothetical protein